MSEHDAATREQKAFRRVVAASRTLAKQLGKTDLSDAVSTANHNDLQVRGMRRMEALAALLEELAGGDHLVTSTAVVERAKKLDLPKSTVAKLEKEFTADESDGEQAKSE